MHWNCIKVILCLLETVMILGATCVAGGGGSVANARITVIEAIGMAWLEQRRDVIGSNCWHHNQIIGFASMT